MKTIFKSSFLMLSFLIMACDGGGSGDETVVANLGSFAGSIQVTDDPRTAVAYIFNSRVKVDRIGDEATIRMTGDLGFNKVLLGTIESESGDTFTIELRNQTEPDQELVSGDLVIIGNALTFTLNIGSDSVQVKDQVEDEESFELSGKLGMIGTDMIRE